MSKRKTVSATMLAVSALATICLLAAVITAQKGPNTTTGAPLKGVDVKLGRNPGGSAAARTGTTDEKGAVKFVGLPPGNYSLTLVGPSNQQKVAIAGAVAAADYVVEINGAVGGPIKREWNVKEKKFPKLPPPNADAKATTAPGYEEKISFDVGGGSPAPVLTVIIRSKSNITNN
jgi:hypothetical protein